MTMRQNPSQEPRDYIGNVSNLAEEAFRTMSPGLAPARPAGPPTENMGTVALAQFSAKVQREVYQQQLELNEARRDNTTLDKENEDLRTSIEAKETTIADLMKKITEETTDHVKVLGEIDTKHNTALSEAKEAHRLEKVEIEGKVTAAETKIGELDTQVSGLTGDLETKLAAAQKELEDKTTELQAKIDELTTANTTLTSEKEALELRVNQLAAGKKGLPVPVAVVKDAPQGAAAAAAAAGTVVTTQTGDPNPPVQVISPGTGFQGAMSEEDEEMIEVLTEFDALHTAATNPDAMRKFVAFRNSPKHGCEGCEQDPTHHAKLITKAMSFDHRPRLTSLIISA